MQSLKPDAPFWVTETCTSANGSTSNPAFAYPLGFNRVNSLMPFAFGAAMNNYWLWRAHPGGHELMHGHVITSQGRPVYNFNECEDVAHILTAAEGFLTGTKPDYRGFAMSVSCKSSVMFTAQPTLFPALITGRPLWTPGTGSLAAGCCRASWSRVCRSTACAFSIRRSSRRWRKGTLRNVSRAWIEAGGIWIAGPMTDIRNADGAKYLDSPFGLIEKLTGIRCDYGITAHSIPAAVNWNGKTADTAVWTDVFTLAKHTKRLQPTTAKKNPRRLTAGGPAYCPVGARRCDRPGDPALPRRRCGTSRRLRLKRRGWRRASVRPAMWSPCGARVRTRGVILCETERRPGKAYLDGEYQDVVKGKSVSGTLELPPYGFQILRKIR